MSSSSIYSIPDDDATKNFVAPNIVTIAKALDGKCLTKIFISKDQVKPTDKAFMFSFLEVEINNLVELANVIESYMHRPQFCLLRCRIKDEDNRIRVRRLFNCEDSTLIEQPQNWFAVDIDGYGKDDDKYTGDLLCDTQQVLLALGWQDTECLSLASSSYGIKPGIHLRLFFWANQLIDHSTLKRLLMNNKAGADLALFHPIQQIYIATPIFFNGMINPVKERFIHLIGRPNVIISDKLMYEQRYAYRHSDRNYTKTQAKQHLAKAFKDIAEAIHGSRHEILKHKSLWIGNRIRQGLIDEEEAFEYLMFACGTWGDGNSKKDAATIRDMFKRAMESKEDF